MGNGEGLSVRAARHTCVVLCDQEDVDWAEGGQVLEGVAGGLEVGEVQWSQLPMGEVQVQLDGAEGDLGLGLEDVLRGDSGHGQEVVHHSRFLALQRGGQVPWCSRCSRDWGLGSRWCRGPFRCRGGSRGRGSWGCVSHEGAVDSSLVAGHRVSQYRH